MSDESFANFDFSGFNGVLNGNDFNPVKENIGDRVVEKKDISGGKSFIGAVNKFVAENLEKRAKKTRKDLNPKKYEKEERMEKLNQVEETLEEKQKDLVEAKKELSSSKTISKTEKKRLEMKINSLQNEIVELREIKDIMLSDFSYGNYETKSREDAGYNMDYQKLSNGVPNHGENSERFSSNEYLEQKLQRYLKKHPNAFKQDHQQSGRDDRPSL